ncbi:nuclear transport factor 2 family protein [Kaistia dalseonensis]|uniref:Ketosteroid isomerase-like protein n=1 Tax=Kaistia dalseonensis TaxID=410840 RepID=A0ABU0H607_9HYPH|nr:nuclear transport factor 2 family protein [Kaistia dalseonensis]MCX5495149.1 nuclear transport factor 2 family protein [Kaistia dalseonensis]MDQ0437731.1 ketosteroid isomerase-like protein [Kaistia dalseonensis]
MQPATDPIDLLERYGTLINQHRFEVLAPLIDADAIFWFNDGSFSGLDSIRTAFETTWARYPEERYWLEDVSWIARSSDAASCLYRFRWNATIDGRPASGSGRGTTIMRCTDGIWRIIHEHLSAEPKKA